MSKDSGSSSKRKKGKPKAANGEIPVVAVPPEYADQFAELPESVATSKRSVDRPRVIVKPSTILFSHETGRGNFEKLEYNLGEIAKAEATESYVMRSFAKHVTLMLKNGFYLDGRNPETIEYVYFRLREIERNTNVPFAQVMRSISQNLVGYSNAFVVFKRDGTRSSGKPLRIFGRDLQPIAGVFSADATTMEIKRNENGIPQAWRQWDSAGGEKLFRKENVVHIHYNRKDGFIGGTPWIVPVLDDIRCWRKMEELLELLVSKHTFPLFHYKVGSENKPAREYDDGSSEVDFIKAAVEAMPTEGCIVTSERHEITVVGAEGKALDLSNHLEYWENRVISGLNMSGIDLGKGQTANRATATQMSKSLADFCSELQSILSTFIDFYLLDILLEEGGFKVSEFNRVHLQFPVIDFDEQAKVEKHAEYMFQANMITEDEARRRIGMQPITKAMRKGLAMTLIDIPLAIIRASDEPGTPESRAAMKATTKATKTASTSRKAQNVATQARQRQKNKSENINRPTNQGGKLVAKTKPVRDAIISDWDSIPVEMGGNLKERLDEFKRFLLSRMLPILAQQMEEGMHDCHNQMANDDLPFVGKNMRRYLIDNCVSPKLNSILESLDSVDELDSRIRLASRLGAVRPLLGSFLERAEVAAYNYGFRYAAMLAGLDSVRWEVTEEACDSCKEMAERPRPLKKLMFDELSPVHVACIKGPIITDE